MARGLVFAVLTGAAAAAFSGAPVSADDVTSPSGISAKIPPTIDIDFSGAKVGQTLHQAIVALQQEGYAGSVKFTHSGEEKKSEPDVRIGCNRTKLNGVSVRYVCALGDESHVNKEISLLTLEKYDFPQDAQAHTADAGDRHSVALALSPFYTEVGYHAYLEPTSKAFDLAHVTAIDETINFAQRRSLAQSLAVVEAKLGKNPQAETCAAGGGDADGNCTVRYTNVPERWSKRSSAPLKSAFTSKTRNTRSR